MPDLRPLAPADAALALPALRELRPHAPATAGVSELAAYLHSVEAKGYRLVGVFESGRTEAAAVAGYRVYTMLAFGRALYVDDLSTLPDARGRGHARALLAWLEAEARRLGCDSLQLDSGVGERRWTAHRLYLSTGFNISCHHFEKGLT
ncbi:N-acetyltransferase GCN5 [Deinococcus aetherius]|uniref:N-acetyltransferase GCN5 n=1 Tax=Deinococcus aetherius TaxID=200252 RepID=A0ABN6RG33_9DEIO|nr:GNAT family N-acetyltransferase [Deinococcus aetherius]BDP42317.1 N-acetyltransferase GCN5 [Deinococcus aetherius]